MLAPQKDVAAKHRRHKVDEELVLFRLLTLEAVQQDLGVTADQIRQLDDIHAVGAKTTSQGKAARALALAILTPDQAVRLKQLQVQAAIPSALATSEVIAALEISKEQQVKIDAIGEDMERQESAEWPELRRLNANEEQRALRAYARRSNELHAEAARRMLEELTPKQQEKFDELQGKKIDVARLQEALFPQDDES